MLIVPFPKRCDCCYEFVLVRVVYISTTNFRFRFCLLYQQPV